MKKKKAILAITMPVPLACGIAFIGYKSDDDDDHHGHYHHQQQEQQYDQEQQYAVKASTP